MLARVALLFSIVGVVFTSYGQSEEGRLTGNIQSDIQYYLEDTIIGAEKVDEKIRSNTYAQIDYAKGNFRAGVRLESYERALIGYDPLYNGTGIANRYIRYQTDLITLTVGNFYDQFGSGMIFRTYEDRFLGIDNSLDGLHVLVTPLPGVQIKVLSGRQRLFFTKGEGIVRGADGEWFINESFESLIDKKSKIILGAGVISKFQADDDPVYNLPENVAAYAGRFNLIRGGFSLQSEVAYKINDPSLTNNFSYNEGKGFMVTSSYSQKGFSVSGGVKRIDNMDFRSDRNAGNNNLTLSFLPAFTKQHTYQLAAYYPYGTQPNGEIALQGEVSYKVPKGSQLGGKYGTQVTVSHSTVRTNNKAINAFSRIYDEDFISTGDVLLFRENNIEINRKFNKKWKGNFQYLSMIYDKDRIEQQAGFGKVFATIGVADITYKINRKNAIRTEFQAMFTEQDQGNWAMALAEYTVSPHWFIAVIDEYNYGNDVEKKRVHYLNTNVGYVQGSSRIALAYGKQRAGIICVGGVCRVLPATNGLRLSISTSF
ncbi:MAG: hypothetical protein ACJAZ3_000572 [Sphingobacteriales bacterium]|jgi:hypothetical protein